jgi:hypothetical protein
VSTALFVQPGREPPQTILHRTNSAEGKPQAEGRERRYGLN